MSREKEQQSGFLSRWSARKLDPQTHADAEPVTDGAASPQPEQAQPAPLPAEDVPIWQRDDVDAGIKKQALKALFRSPEFNDRDGLNEYDDDFTQFQKLGDIVTHEMKRMLKLAEQHTRPDTAVADNKTLPEFEQDDGDNETKEDDSVA